MLYDIKRGETVLTTVRLTGTQTRRVMSVNIVQAEFSLPDPVEFTIGDHITVFGEEYYLNTLPQVSKNPGSVREFKYSCTFEAVGYKLGDVQYMFLGDDNTIKEADFALMGNADAFVGLILTNMNRVDSGWSKGVIADTDFRNLTFSKENCLQVLTRLAEEFNTEFWLDGKTIHLTRKGETSSLVFEYGKNKGMRRVSRANKGDKICTRLYAFGSEKNLPGDYRNYSNRLKMPASTGLYLENNVDKFGVIEHTEIFEDVYPHRIGKVTEVGATIYEFFDSGIDFDVNQYRIKGVEAKLTFNTGQLAGYQFLFKFAEKKFTILKNEDEKALELPTEALRPAVGDEYVLTDINMPQSYVDAAERELQVRAQEYLDKNSTPQVLYSVECDPLAFRRNGVLVHLGSYVRVKDADLGLNKLIRVIGLTRALDNAYAYTLDLADTATLPSVIRQYSQQEKIERVIRMHKLADVNRARLNYKTSQELRQMIYDPGDPEYYSRAIQPLVVETVNLTVGTKAQQFLLNGLVFTANADGNINRLRWTAGTLDHFTIAEEVRSWNIPGGLITGLSSPVAYYLYAKCERGGVSGSMLITEQKIKTEADPGFYHFLIGVLHSAMDNVRGISLTYGQTAINGRFITTGVIRSQDGSTYFDLDKGEIGGNIIFKANDRASEINGDVITTGSILLTDPSGAIGAGMTGKGSGAGAVRFWAGSPFDGRGSAPFRVYQDGKVYTNNLEADGGKIGAWELDSEGMHNADGTAYISFFQQKGQWYQGAGFRLGLSSVSNDPFDYAVAYFGNSSYNPEGSNKAVVISAEYAKYNEALTVEGITYMNGGQRVNLAMLRGRTNITCGNNDFLIIQDRNVSSSIYLPKYPMEGQVIETLRYYGAQNTIYGNGHKIRAKGNDVDSIKDWWHERFTFTGSRWIRHFN